MKQPSKNSPQPKWINIVDFEFICFNLAKQILELDEPIPDYSTHNNTLLESSLAAPRQHFEYNGSSINEQAIVLFYSLIKNHPFENGNKRIAVVTLLVFLGLNDKWLEIDPSVLYDVAIHVAESNPKQRSVIIKNISKLFDKHIVDNKI